MDMSFSALCHDEDIKVLILNKGIQSESLRIKLTNHLKRVLQHIFEVMHIQAAIAAQNDMINAAFQQTLFRTQQSYDSLMKDNLLKTIESAGNVHDIFGIAGFTVGVLSRVISSAIKVNEAESVINEAIKSHAKNAKHHRRDTLTELREKISFHAKALSDYLDPLYTSINLAQTNKDEILKAKAFADEINDNLQGYFVTIIDKVQKMIDEILRRIASHQEDIETKLPISLMSIYLLRGTKGGSHHPYLRFKHAMRYRAISSLFKKSIIFKAANHISPKALTQKEIKALTGILKRYPEVDMDPSSQCYINLTCQLQRALHLINKGERRTEKENRVLFSARLLCDVDKLASKDHDLKACLDSTLHRHHHFFSYGQSAQTIIKEVLDTKYMCLNHNIDNTGYLFRDEIQGIAEKIITFYINQLLREYVLEEGVSVDSVTILQFIVNIINVELADKTPSEYYGSYLSGLSAFNASLDGESYINLSLTESGVSLNFHGLLSKQSTSSLLNVNTEIANQLGHERRHL